MNENFLEWRIKKYSVFLTITRIFNTKADTAFYIMKLDLLVKRVINKYGLENVKAVITHTIRFRKIDNSKSIFEWSKNSKFISFENDEEKKRDYHELVLQCKPKTIQKIAKQIMLYEVASQRSDTLCVDYS